MHRQPRPDERPVNSHHPVQIRLQHSVVSGRSCSWTVWNHDHNPGRIFDMATIRAHEFISLDGVFESPTWTMEFGFDPQMGEAIGALTGGSDAIMLGRTTYEMFAPARRDRTVEEDPGAPFFNNTEKFVVGAHELSEEWANTTR